MNPVISRLGKNLILIISLALMAACTPVITNVCPPIKQYSPQFSKKLADELEKLPEGNPIIEVTADYINLRDQLKICRSK